MNNINSIFANNYIQRTNPFRKKDMKSKLRQLSDTKPDTDKTGIDAILESSKSYLETLKAERVKMSDTALKTKSQKYQYKDLSARIVRSKTSVSARQLASQARREVQRLKRERRNAEGDTKELDAAIEHAKSMERVARKKARHLEQEELAKGYGNIGIANISEEEDIKTSEEDEYKEEYTEAEYEEIESESAEEEYVDSEGLEAYEEMQDKLFDEMSEEIKALLEDMGLEETTESVYGLEPDDIKAMKIKHRNSEMKDIVKADTKYLKVLFEGFNEQRIDITI